ncbi:hypothetical protein SASPL_141002 [Salvia splendens]|uniref:Uncharacterized protein n=1 Tax=Salvia splendens TaxID=180675 RepID=A0A8X8ZC55_SALSN|nr:hypothetical protein SASPL_141002 [Salvia splendens]
MAERRYGGRRGDARGSSRGGRRRDLPNKEVARQHDLRDIENDDLRQQVRDLQRDIENGDLRQQRRSMDNPLFSDVFTSSDADEPSKNSNSNIFSMPVYDTPVYDEDIFYELSEPPKNSKNNILSMSVYDKPVYDGDIFYELLGLVSKSLPPSVKFDNAAEDEGINPCCDCLPPGGSCGDEAPVGSRCNPSQLLPIGDPASSVALAGSEGDATLSGGIAGRKDDASSESISSPGMFDEEFKMRFVVTEADKVMWERCMAELERKVAS